MNTDLRLFTQPVHEEFPSNLQGKYKMIMNEHGKLLSVVKKTYKLKTNEEVIESCLRAIEHLKLNYYIDDRHSFIRDTRMKLSLVFPNEVIYKESTNEKSKIYPSMYIHNSYDYQEGVRVIFGFIRAICTNGAIWGDYTKFYQKHTQNISLNTLTLKVDNFMNNFPQITERIRKMEVMNITKDLAEKCLKIVGQRSSENSGIIIDGKKFKDEIDNLWLAFQECTYAISHFANITQQSTKQNQLFKLFNDEIKHQERLATT